ncbi:class I SAM-dependent RNA methyltransferase [Deltaproteobacteria bacterium PRO3]|nr:class I SAM-dependent RNA methyltransferase [Deltaproteobacteria bacterium PRO3]
MKPKTVLIAGLDEGGRGVALIDGEKAIVPFSIPGETWRVAPQATLLEPSPDRVAPPCPYFGRCGGCQLQHMSEGRQLAEKQRWLAATLARIVPPEKIRPPIPSPKHWHYRRRIQLHVGPKGEVGFYAHRSREVVPIDACRIADPALNAKLLEVKRRAQSVLQGTKKPASLTFELTLQEDGSVEIRQDGEERSFLQVNPEANQRLIEVLQGALAALRPRRVLELFAGSGNLSFPLAVPGVDWLAVESNPRAGEEGRRRSEQEGRVQWRLGQAAKTAEKLYQSGERFDLVILDPPRGGAEDCLPVFRKRRPPAILYVSCHPPALKKDLQVLVKAGYAVDWVQAIDFFPQTMNLETVVQLRDSGSDSKP